MWRAFDTEKEMNEKRPESRDLSASSLPIFDEANGITRTMRLHAPLHFEWKIDSYSMLLESKWKKIESGYFEVDGRKWKLTFYPNGDHKHKGDGYISLYLSVFDNEELPVSWDLSVKFKFLVFDQIHDNYLVVRGVHEVYQFHRMKTEWGFAQLLSLDDFKDPANGYLHDDCCILGVDVSVIKRATRGEIFKVKTLVGGNSYTFKIEKLSTIDKEYVESEVFTIKEMKWKLRLYPNGDSAVKDKVSLFLVLASDLPHFSSKVYAKVKLRLIDQVLGKHHEKITNLIFSHEQVWGLPCFATLSDVKNPSKGFLVNDTIITEVQIDYLSTRRLFQ